jgi:hypothetical protein
MTADYIMVTGDALTKAAILNAQRFVNCRFTECKFYYVSFLVNERDWAAFDAWGGCNWITPTPKDLKEVPLIQTRPPAPSPIELPKA